METLTLKSGSGWTLQAKYWSGQVRLVLKSQADGREYGDYMDLGLDANEWDRLVKWVEYIRASERLNPGLVEVILRDAESFDVDSSFNESGC